MQRPPKQLIKEWYGKLKDTGFKDIESLSGKVKLEGTLAHHKIRVDAKTDGTISSLDQLFSFRSKTEYFRLAGLFYHDYDHFTTQEKLIWGYHQDGLTVREISDKLPKEYKLGKTQVNETVLKLAKVMLHTGRTWQK